MDGRYETFLTLCKVMNYRKTAEMMHLSQPAVTRQIQSLEAEFATKLFLYDRHRLSKTPAADILEHYIISLRQNYAHLQMDMRSEMCRTVRVGATKTIGDYVIPDAVQRYLAEEKHNLSLEISNTEILLKKLSDSELDFAIVEGMFDKSRYASRLLRLEEFTGICEKGHRFAGQIISLETVLGENLIVREKGSGTRNLLERELFKNGYSVDRFRRCTEISSFPVIVKLVSGGTGVSFVYRAVVEGRSDIARFQVKGFEKLHEFNVVWLKHTEIPEAGELFLQSVWQESRLERSTGKLRESRLPGKNAELEKSQLPGKNAELEKSRLPGKNAELEKSRLPGKNAELEKSRLPGKNAEMEKSRTEAK